MDFDRIDETLYLQRLVPALMEWYPDHRRILPWRERPLPYYVWVSEIMLQQTRVEAVKPYYERFLEALPTVRALAGCPQDRLMKLWEGLGYYSRASNLQKAAIRIVEDFGGRVPEDVKDLLTLPGIGPYTAAAISSIAYGCCQAAVDGNVLRVLSRICMSQACIDDPKVRKAWEKALREVMAEAMKTGNWTGNFPGTFNQAMMEVGATVCLPNGQPDCGRCPCRTFCRATQAGRQGDFPVRKGRKSRKVEERTVLVIADGDHTVLHKRPDKGLLAGLWELPNFPNLTGKGQVEDRVRQMGLTPLGLLPLPKARHIFTHVEWRMEGWLVLVEPIGGTPSQPDKHADGTGDTEDTGHTESSRNTEDTGKADGTWDFCLQDRSGTVYLVTRPEQAGEMYAIPAAFSAYTGYLGLRPRSVLLREQRNSAGCKEKTAEDEEVHE